MSAQKTAGLVGVTGYTGMELVRLLAGHPNLKLVAATSRAQAGKRLGELYPYLGGTYLAEITVIEPDAAALAKSCDVVFLAVPHGAAMDMAGKLVDAGARVVDLSADFRLRDEAVYSQWYGLPHARADLLAEAVYGLPELYAAKIASARLVANPGCYPTSAILGLTPALAAGLIHADDIVVDSKSGATGAGRKAAVGTLFCEVQDSFRAYNVAGKHRHTPEIEQECALAAGAPLTLSFNPHLLPINRGILSTIYTRLKTEASAADIRAVYEEFTRDTPFTRLLPEGTLPETRWVRGTMYCDIGLAVDTRAKRLIILAAIDNLCRGASGQALANANLMLGLPLGTGLPLAPLVP